MSRPGKRGAAEAPPVIVVRRKGRHGGHHGGAWKVAYADFVTTMMALFIVLWAAGQDTSVREAIAAYFRSPSIVPQAVSGAGVLPALTGAVASADLLANESSPDRESRLLRDVAVGIQAEIERMPDLKPLLDQVQITLTAEGLRIQMTERDESLFFEVGSARVRPSMVQLLAVIAAAVGRLPNRVLVEGHTDARQYGPRRLDYSNWELSADRANSARRVLEHHGLQPGQVVRVVGYADHELLEPGQPLDPKNRRVSVLVLRTRPVERAAGPGAGAPPALPGLPARPAGETRS
jgi:chemotaxis protein MotB